MLLLANENLPATAVRLLRQQGHDVLWAKESLQGESDTVILAKAQADGRIVVTQDKDFGELAFRHNLPAACGIILFRLDGDDPDVDITRMVTTIESRTDWAGNFAVVTNDRVRIRPLPGP